MKFLKISAIAMALLAAPLTGAASAKTLSYDFTGQGQTATSFDFSSEGVDLTVRGSYSFFGPQTGILTRWSNGLGLTSFSDREHEIDGSVFSEFVSFEFSESVDRLDSLTFNFVDRKDSFTILDSNWNTIFDSKISQDETGKVTFAFDQGTELSGSMFYLGATGKHDNYKLRGLTASVAEVAPVPLPAGGLLLISGLIGIAAARRRRARTA